MTKYSQFDLGPTGGDALIYEFEAALRSIPGMVRQEVFEDHTRQTELFEQIYASESSIYYEIRTYANDNYDVIVTVVRWSNHGEAWPPKAEVDNQWSIDPYGLRADVVFGRLRELCAKDAEIIIGYT